MAVAEEAEGSELQGPVAPSKSISRAAAEPIMNRVLNFLSSVRLGIVLLITLVVLSMIGMLVMQQNVAGFDRYYFDRTPSEKLVYGALGFFDVYHVWYFDFLLLVLSLNIILASIDRAPLTWRIVKQRKLTASPTWLHAQQFSGSLNLDRATVKDAAARVRKALGQFGFKVTETERDGAVHYFAEKGWWNRLTYLAVHVALLTIFTGGFLTAQLGRDGQVPLEPGESASTMSHSDISLTNVGLVTDQLPFTITCTDIQQKLIKSDGTLTADNTIDWLTRVKIKDEYGERDALVHLNSPYDYRGYRFFQASFIGVGRARTITLQVTAEHGGPAQDVTIQRNGSATLSDGTRLDFKDFRADFQANGESEGAEYTNPAAFLQVTGPTGEVKQAFAFTKDLPASAPVAAPVLGYRFKLMSFEKAPLQHVLAVNKDPGKMFVYLGFSGLLLTLGAVFFFSHQRVWARVEESPAGSVTVTMAGNTNRNRLGFDDRFKKLQIAITDDGRESQ